MLQTAGYQISEPGDDSDSDSSTTTDNSGNQPDNSSQDGNGPVRLARFSYIEGNVSWRPDSNSDWSDASVNLPLRQGAQIWVTGNGRAEIQFDDGGYLRLGDSAVATLQSMYSDDNGEFTEVRLNDGLASLDLRNERSLYQVDTSLGSVTADGPARVRVGSNSGLEVAVRDGSAKVETENGDTSLDAGDYVYLPTADDTMVVDAVPGEDDWDQFNDSRDQQINNPNSDQSRYLPASIQICAGNLDTYGSWHDDPQYGEVWCPREDDPNWRPYASGHWVWVNPFGWTWVASDAWGWAPYHYGTWVDESWGWSWVPGPARQYWSPAVVHFSESNGTVAWVALAPSEVHYTNVSIAGWGHPDWWLHFSIGGCAVYAASGPSFCEPRPWVNADLNCNRVVVPPPPAGPTVAVGAVFVPHNAVHGFVSVSTGQFAVAVSYNSVSRGGEDFFRGGVDVGIHGGVPLGGPAFIAPTHESWTPARSFHPQGVAPDRLNRPVFRAAVPVEVARNSDNSGQFITGRHNQPGGNSNGNGFRGGNNNNGGNGFHGGASNNNGNGGWNANGGGNSNGNGFRGGDNSNNNGNGGGNANSGGGNANGNGFRGGDNSNNNGNGGWHNGGSTTTTTTTSTGGNGGWRQGGSSTTTTTSPTSGNGGWHQGGSSTTTSTTTTSTGSNQTHSTGWNNFWHGVTHSHGSNKTNGSSGNKSNSNSNTKSNQNGGGGNSGNGNGGGNSGNGNGGGGGGDRSQH